MICTADIMTKSIKLRTKLGEDANSPIDIFALAQDIEQLTIVYYPMGENLSGICLKGASGNNVIAINSSMTLGRQRFSLAHELYHLYFDKNMTAVCAQKIGMGQETEKEADLFASYFLMPAAALQTKVEMLKAKNNSDDLSIHDVIRLEQYFQVSHQAAVIRLRQDKLLNADAADAMMSEGVRRFAESMGYSTELYKPLPAEKQYMTYGNYIDQAEQVLKRGLVSDGKYEELLLTAFRSDLVYGGNEEGEEVID